MKLVIVEWMDSSQGEGWTPVSEIEDGCIAIRSVGWVLRETKDVLVIAPHHGERLGRDTPEQACGYMKIPKLAVKRVRELKEPR